MSALLFTPWPLGIVLIAPHAGRWADTISAPAISTLGLVIFVVGLILLATLPARPSMWDICLRSLVCGIGFGCFQSPNNREMLSNVIREHASYASGVLSIMRTFGQCLGAAAVAVLLAADEGQFMLRCGAPPRPLRYRSSSARAGCVKSPSCGNRINVKVSLNATTPAPAAQNADPATKVESSVGVQ